MQGLLRGAGVFDRAERKTATCDSEKFLLNFSALIECLTYPAHSHNDNKKY